MIFRLVKPTTVKIPCPVESPDGQTATIVLEVRYKTVTEVSTLVEEMASGTMNDLMLAQRLVVGWERVADDKGNEIAWTEHAFEDAMDLPYFHRAVGQAIVEHLAGGRKKNLRQPDDSGLEESTT